MMLMDKNVAINVTPIRIHVSRSNGKKNFSYGVYFSAGLTNILNFKFSITFDDGKP
jgi:hypothetical protein